MDGFVVLAQVRRDGERWLAVETIADADRGARTCGCSSGGNGRRRVRGARSADRRDADDAVWAQAHLAVPRRRSARRGRGRRRRRTSRRGPWLTERARGRSDGRVGEELDTVAEAGPRVRCRLGDRGSVRDRLRRRRDRGGRPDRPGRPKLGVDEHTFAHGDATDGGSQMATTFVDLTRGRLLEVVPEVDPVRSCATGSAASPPAGLDEIEVAAIDAFRGYATVIGGRLPDATLVIDHFHAIRLANQATTESVDASSKPRSATAAARGPALRDPPTLPAPGELTDTRLGTPRRRARRRRPRRRSRCRDPGP